MPKGTYEHSRRNREGVLKRRAIKRLFAFCAMSIASATVRFH